jgi:putative FmdB family regulatory protein
MPLYEYACERCGHRFETRQGIRESALTECPQCGGPIRRVVQAVGIVFKGSGFYKTDSRSTSAASVPPADKKTSPAPATPAKESSPSSSDSSKS